MSDWGREAVGADDEVVPAAELRRLEERVRDLERLLGRKTMKNGILKEALDLARAKKAILLSSSVLPDGSARPRSLEHRRARQGRTAETRTADPR
jgi:transposase